MESNFQLYHGDCLELMKQLPDGSVDMILCDLPYGTTRNKWDSVLPLDALWREYGRICRGAIVLTAQTPFDKVLGASNLEMLRYEWIWHKSRATGHLNSKRQPMKNHENVLVFYRGVAANIQPAGDSPKDNPYHTQGGRQRNKLRKVRQGRTARVRELPAFSASGFQRTKATAPHPKTRRADGVPNPHVHQRRRNGAG